MTRREALKRLSAAGIGLATLPGLAEASKLVDDPDLLIEYLESHARPDHGYAWPDQSESHLTPTYAVVGCYRLLGRQPPRRRELIQFIRAHHPHRFKKPERELRSFDFQQVQSLKWLDDDVSDFEQKARAWTEPAKYPMAYERAGLPPFQQEVMALLCRQLLGLPVSDLSPQFSDFVRARKRSNGSFNQTPATDGSDGHVMNTWWGLQAQQALGLSLEGNALVQWLQQCQVTNGGFAYCPGADIGTVPNLTYTWSAVRALALLGAAPRDQKGCQAYLESLRNGVGFAEQPGWAANPLSTFFALDTLTAVGGTLNPAKRSRSNPSDLPASLKIYTIQIEAPGQGSPSDAVNLASALRIDLWAAKNSPSGWIQRAQAIAGDRKVLVSFCVGNEEYGTYASVPGLGTYSHISDLFAPANTDIGASLAKDSPMPWTTFRERRHEQLQRAGGRLFWQFGDNEEFARVLLDDSLQHGGFAAISTFHFGNPDFLNSHPFLNCYRGRLPFIALQDAHGTEPWWWSDNLVGFRTVFLATEPSWEGWMKALKNDWVAAIRHDAVSQYKTWIHAGNDAVREFVRAHERDWKWWSDNPEFLEHPLATTVLLRPDDLFEKGCPERGLGLRVRCRWECSAQGMPKNKLVGLVRLTIDGKPLEFKGQELRNAQSVRIDHFYTARLPSLAPGWHSVETTLRILASGKEMTQRDDFVL